MTYKGKARCISIVTYYAKSKSDFVTNQRVTVKSHCDKVAHLAAQYGSKIEMSDLSEIAGLCHDYGKYGELFQDVLKGIVHSIDHAIPGAVMTSRFSEQVCEAVAAHHHGLVDIQDLKTVLSDVMVGSDCMLPSGKTPSVFGADAFRSAHIAFLSDHPDFNEMVKNVSITDHKFDLKSGYKWKDNLYRMLLERFLFSCLVDADYTTSCYEETGDMPDEASIQADVQACLGRLDALRSGVIMASRADDKINGLRNRVYQNCIDFDVNKSFYLLSAPTGSGKSFAMARFALHQCLAHKHLDRVIFVLPFLTLTDQMAKMAGQIFGDVLVDTSGSRDGEDRRYMTETWNSRCVVTTTVQFFQSLFSDKPGDCRKLHRIANSVIVFDEIQALPADLSRVCLQALYWLTERFHCRILISTATPPAYEYIQELDFKPEILFDRHFGDGFALARTGFDVRPGPLPLQSVAMMAADVQNSCVIVNLRAHAREIYRIWKDVGVRDIYFMSTDLCPDHRRKIIDDISERQKSGLPAHVVSTQCIEAGVDFDFEQVFRAWAPLPSLVQSAGRQDRNGRYLSGNGMVVFLPDDPDRRDRRLYPTAGYYRDTMVTRRFADKLDWSAFDGYYRQQFLNFDESDKLRNALAVRDYRCFADESRLIRSGGVQVVVPYGDVYGDILEAYRSGSVVKRHLSVAAGIMVSTYRKDSMDACCAELVVRRRGVDMPTGVYILLQPECYDIETGLDFSNAGPLMI